MNLNYEMMSAEVASALTKITPTLYSVFSYLTYNLNALGREVTVLDVPSETQMSVGVTKKNNHKAECKLEYLVNASFDKPGTSFRPCKFFPNGSAGFFELRVPSEGELEKAARILAEVKEKQRVRRLAREL